MSVEELFIEEYGRKGVCLICVSGLDENVTDFGIRVYLYDHRHH